MHTRDAERRACQWFRHWVDKRFLPLLYVLRRLATAFQVRVKKKKKLILRINDDIETFVTISHRHRDDVIVVEVVIAYTAIPLLLVHPEESLYITGMLFLSQLYVISRSVRSENPLKSSSHALFPSLTKVYALNF